MCFNFLEYIIIGEKNKKYKNAGKNSSTAK